MTRRIVFYGLSSDRGCRFLCHLAVSDGDVPELRAEGLARLATVRQAEDRARRRRVADEVFDTCGVRVDLVAGTRLIDREVVWS
jgi:hypothetical protein